MTLPFLFVRPEESTHLILVSTCQNSQIKISSSNFKFRLRLMIRI